MSKLTFRADDELVTRLEEGFDASKSEVLREALREHIERHADDPVDSAPSGGVGDRIDDLLAERVDDLLAERIDAMLAERVDDLLAERVDDLLAERVGPAHGAQDINVNITLDSAEHTAVPESSSEETAGLNVSREAPRGASHASSHNGPERKTEAGGGENTADGEHETCTKCGEILSPSHVHCPNCGEKSTHRVFCECGDELRSDWGFCPGCGRRTAAADVLDSS